MRAAFALTAAAAGWQIFAVLAGHPMVAWEQITTSACVIAWCYTTSIYYRLWKHRPPG